MRTLFFCATLVMTGCSSIMPGIDEVLEDYITEEAINVTIDKTAIKDNTDVQIEVKVTNPSIRPH